MSCRRCCNSSMTSSRSRADTASGCGLAALAEAPVGQQAGGYGCGSCWMSSVQVDTMCCFVGWLTAVAVVDALLMPSCWTHTMCSGDAPALLDVAWLVHSACNEMCVVTGAVLGAAW